MYLNVYYFGLYWGMELLFLFIKFFWVANYTWFLYDLFLLAVLGAVESLRLYISQVDDLGKQLFLVFRILVLTLPSQYLVAYFTFYQTRLTQLDVVLGLIMLVTQFIQLCCAFVTCLPKRNKISLRMLFSSCWIGFLMPQFVFQDLSKDRAIYKINEGYYIFSELIDTLDEWTKLIIQKVDVKSFLWIFISSHKVWC